MLKVKKEIEMEVPRMLPIQRVIDRLSEKITQMPIGQPSFADDRYTPHEFSKDHFQLIKKMESRNKFGYVDGGNAPIYESSNISVHLTRVFFNIFRDGVRLNPRHLPQRIEFYTICYATAENGQIFYETELVPIKPEWAGYLPDVKDLKFYSFDPTLMSGSFRIPIGRIAETSRKFAEWKVAGLMIDYEMDEGDAVIRDGTLQTTVTNERIYSNEVMAKAMEKDVLLVGLSKTSTLFTTTGYPLLAAIAELVTETGLEKDAWYYHPIVNIEQPDHRAEMYAVRLHPSSDYVFRLEFLKEQALKKGNPEIEKYICSLSKNASDPAFPGYPYGLIDADKFARVTGSEKMGQNLQFLSCASSSGVLDRLKKCLKTTDAHDFLNKLMGD